MTKTILKYASFAFIAISFILLIITLINFYSYTNALATIQSGTITELAKFELQEAKNLYLYRTLAILPWTCFVSLIAITTSGTTLYLNLRSKRNFNKIR